MEPASKQGPTKEIQLCCLALWPINTGKGAATIAAGGGGGGGWGASGRPADARKLRKTTAELISRSVLLPLLLEQQARRRVLTMPATSRPLGKLTRPSHS